MKTIKAKQLITERKYANRVFKIPGSDIELAIGYVQPNVRVMLAFSPNTNEASGLPIFYEHDIEISDKRWVYMGNGMGYIKVDSKENEEPLPPSGVWFLGGFLNK